MSSQSLEGVLVCWLQCANLLTHLTEELGLVGVPGFLLGGGISFFGNEYGWASANVVQYDVSFMRSGSGVEI